MSEITVKQLGVTCSLATDEHGQKAVTESSTGLRIVMVASTAAVDRDGETIDVDGWQWGDVLPKLLWGHNAYEAEAVIGRLTKVWKDAGRLMIEAELADKVPGAETAALVAGLMSRGFLDQGSVGFIPLEWKDPDGKTYTRENPGPYWGSNPGRRYTKAELLEFSIVPVPSQRDSVLQGMRSLGLAPALVVPTPAPVKEAEPTPEVAAPEASWITRFFSRPPDVRDAWTKAKEALAWGNQSAERADDEEAA